MAGQVGRRLSKQQGVAAKRTCGQQHEHQLVRQAKRINSLADGQCNLLIYKLVAAFKSMKTRKHRICEYVNIQQQSYTLVYVCKFAKTTIL